LTPWKRIDLGEQARWSLSQNSGKALRVLRKSPRSDFPVFRALYNLEWFARDWDDEVDVLVEPEL
jgi:hypothetical protein